MCLIRRVKNRGKLVQFSPWKVEVDRPEVTVSGNAVGYKGRFWKLGPRWDKV